MNSHEIGELQDIYNRLGRILAEAKGDPNAREATPPPVDPTPKTDVDLVTPKQLGLIRALAREAGVDHDLECGFVMKVKTHELSKRAASSFIDHLNGLKAKKGAAA